MPRIEDEIQKNRRDTARGFAADRQPAQRTERALSTAAVPVDVTADVTVYTRPINDTLIGSHPDGSQGWGRGRVGDYRGGWTSQATVSTSLARGGRLAIAEALAGADISVDGVDVGDVVTNAFDIDSGAASTTARGSARFDESPATVQAVKLTDSQGRVVVESSAVDVAAGVRKEVRLDVELSFSGDGDSDQAVTGIGVVADAIRQTTSEDIGEVVLGTDGTQPTQSDTALGNEIERKRGRPSTTGSQSLLTAIVDRTEPSTQPHDIRELGVVSSNGALVARVVFASETKDDRIRLRARGGINIK